MSHYNDYKSQGNGAGLKKLCADGRALLTELTKGLDNGLDTVFVCKLFISKNTTSVPDNAIASDNPTKSWLLNGPENGIEQPLGFDHVNAVTMEDGRRMVQGQPYSLSNSHILELAKLINEGFEVSITGRSDYAPFDCVLVEISEAT